MTAKKTIFSGTKRLRRMIWIHFIYGKCRFGWLVLHLTLSRDAFCITEEIISSNLLNGTRCYCFMAAHGTKTGVTPRVISPKQRTVLSLSKSQRWLSIAYRVKSKHLFWQARCSTAWALGETLSSPSSLASLHSRPVVAPCGEVTLGWRTPQ